MDVTEGQWLEEAKSFDFSFDVAARTQKNDPTPFLPFVDEC